MKFFLAVLVSFTLSLERAVAQYSDLVRIRSGHQVGEEFPKKLRYRYEGFQVGTIMYANGKFRGKHLLNYDFLLEVMLNVQPTGDTVVVVEQPDFKYYLIKKDTFFYGKNFYVEILAGHKSAKFGVRETYQIKRRDRRSEDGYGGVIDQTNSVESIRNSGYGRMVRDQDILMRKAIYYYLVDKDGLVHHASKSNFLKVFQDKKKSIQNYINRAGTNFKSKEDLMRLFAYCTE